jgi:hypothetical protein
LFVGKNLFRSHIADFGRGNIVFELGNQSLVNFYPAFLGGFGNRFPTNFSFRANFTPLKNLTKLPWYS